MINTIKFICHFIYKILLRLGYESEESKQVKSLLTLRTKLLKDNTELKEKLITKYIFEIDEQEMVHLKHICNTEEIMLDKAKENFFNDFVSKLSIKSTVNPKSRNTLFMFIHDDSCI